MFKNYKINLENIYQMRQNNSISCVGRCAFRFGFVYADGQLIGWLADKLIFTTTKRGLTTRTTTTQLLGGWTV